MNYISKILLNSLYGRFGLGEVSDFTEIITKKEFNELLESDKAEIINLIDLGKNVLVQYSSVYLEKELGENNDLSQVNIAIASAVTAYARIHMSLPKHPDFLKKHNINLYYTDTDSLYLDGPLPNHMVDPSRLGAFKLEGVWDKGLFLSPKVYALENTETEDKIIKIKGLKKESFRDLTLGKLSFLLNKDASLEFKQIKWFKYFDEGEIEIIDNLYNLKVTQNKRELIFINGKLTGTRPIILK
jgi:DNA polymerase elongation subunit (family B)